MTDARGPVAGRFVWCELLTTDVDAVLGFYAGLFNWTARGGPGTRGTRRIFRSGDRDVGGIDTLADGTGLAAGWLSHVAVDRLAVAVESVTAHGGCVRREASAMPDGGRAAAVADPQGAVFSLLEGRSVSAVARAAAIPGRFCWNELVAADPAGATTFYRDAVGWTARARGAGASWLFRLGDQDVAGMVATADAASFWLPYVEVVSAEETAALAEELGGQVLVQPGDVPGRGRSAVVCDPAGARLGVFALTHAA